MKYLFALGLAVMLIIAVLSCSESKFVEPEEPTFVVNGTVYSVYCLGPYGWWFPYTDSLNLSGIVTFTDTASSDEFTSETDSTSVYATQIPQGVYYVKLETPHARARINDTISVTADTVLDLYFKIEWHWHDTMIVLFYYKDIDILAEEQELALIHKLDTLSGGVLLPEHLRKSEEIPFPEDQPYSKYYVPFEYTIRPWLLEDELHEIMNSNRDIFPTYMYADLWSVGCLH